MDKTARVIIATFFLPAFMIGTDFTGAMMLVLPIEREFSADITTTQWVLNIYALTLAMACVAGGRLGDMYGRRRVLLIGLAVFLLASLVCTLAPSIGWLIGARAVQGIGAALTWPCVLGIAATSVKDHERGMVMGLLLGAVALGNVVAPFIAGLLGGMGLWRGFFLFNVLMAAASVAIILWVAPKPDEERADERVDYLGMITLSLALLLLLFGLDVGADWGWTSPWVLGLFVAAIILIFCFPPVERRVPDPMIPPPMMRNRQFLLALATNGTAAPALFIIFLYMPQYSHKVLGWSTLWASVGNLPILISLAVVNPIAGHLYNRIGPRRLMGGGHLLVVAGAFWLAMMAPSWGYIAAVPPMMMVGIGGGLILGPAGTATVNAADPSRAGLAGGLGFMCHLCFGAVGVAAATAWVFTTSLSALKSGLAALGVQPSAADVVTLNGNALKTPAVQEILGRFDPSTAERIGNVISGAFATGLHQAYWLVLAVAAAGFVVSICLDDDRLRHPAPPTAR